MEASMRCSGEVHLHDAQKHSASAARAQAFMMIETAFCLTAHVIRYPRASPDLAACCCNENTVAHAMIVDS
jgi:hypothetical protein